MRIDKFLANKGLGSRKDVHRLLKSGVVRVNEVVVTKKEYSITPAVDQITVKGEKISNTLQYYIKFHKPKGYITAVEDSDPVVMDILPKEFKKMGVFPVGRLDKDTEGLLLLTNDGQWGHRVIHGKKHIPKCYYFEYDGKLTDVGVQRIQEGIILGDGTQCKPADIRLLVHQAGYITIEEGKYHQVKRMIGAAGGTVLYLKRVSIGPIDLAGIETAGTYQVLSNEEIHCFD
ncbi:pseudouridine synthase [Veillonella montpellierensis]|uniref:pseudouridine synthase n=1 Tax=Veillonella montpellierensis TaxID=187328 RepID=UPI0023FA3DD7|nr:pseudouridine synthase [Veillonella montpellierensis]